MESPRERLNSPEGLIDQLGYLLIELEAMEPILAGLDRGLLTVRLPDTGSVLSALGEIAYLDEVVHLPALRGEEVASSALEGEAAEQDAPLEEVMARVRRTRVELVEGFRALPLAGWKREAVIADRPLSLQQLATLIVRRDADVLRQLAENLRHGSLFGTS